MEAILLGKDIVSWILDLSYNGRRLQSNNEVVFFLFQGTLYCVMAAQWVRAGCFNLAGQEI